MENYCTAWTTWVRNLNSAAISSRGTHLCFCKSINKIEVHCPLVHGMSPSNENKDVRYRETSNKIPKTTKLDTNAYIIMCIKKGAKEWTGSNKLTLMYSTKSKSSPWLPSWISFSVVPSASTENAPFHCSNSNAAASSSFAFRALASSSWLNYTQHFFIACQNQYLF